jgi:acyl carrier protein
MADGMVKVLPEAAQLEMVRAAAKLASKEDAGGNVVVRLTDVAWHEPVVVDRDHQVHVDLVPNADGEWTVYAGDGRTEDTITCVGSTGRVTVLPDAPLDAMDPSGSLLVDLTTSSPSNALPVPGHLAACLAAVWHERPVSLLRADEVTYAPEPGGRPAVRAVVSCEMTVTGGTEAMLAIDLIDGDGTSLVRFRGLRVAVPAEAVAVVAGPGRRAGMAGWSVAQCLEWELKDAVSQLLKLPADKLDDTANLQDYGFDSISLVEFAGVLAERLGVDLTPDVTTRRSRPSTARAAPPLPPWHAAPPPNSAAASHA